MSGSDWTLKNDTPGKKIFDIFTRGPFNPRKQCSNNNKSDANERKRKLGGELKRPIIKDQLPGSTHEAAAKGGGAAAAVVAMLLNSFPVVNVIGKAKEEQPSALNSDVRINQTERDDVRKEQETACFQRTQFQRPRCRSLPELELTGQWLWRP